MIATRTFLCLLSLFSMRLTAGSSTTPLRMENDGAKVTTDAEYYQYGVLHKKDIGCAGEYRKQRANGLLAFYRYKKSLKDRMYTNVNATNSENMGGETARRIGVCLRNACATGDLKAVKWLLKQKLTIDLCSTIAAEQLAIKNGHHAMVDVIEDAVGFDIGLYKAYIFVRGAGWSLENERRELLKQNKPTTQQQAQNAVVPN